MNNNEMLTRKKKTRMGKMEESFSVLVSNLLQ
jgi:hypothetical protein